MTDMLQRTLDTARFLQTDPVRTIRVGVTPHTVVFRQGPAALRHFPVPAGTPVSHPPVFVSMPLINTWTVWDLLPGKSVVQGLVEGGVPVYVLDWGRPGDEDAARTLSEYIDGLLHRMVDRAARDAAARYGARQLDAIGYCVGGTFLSVYISRNPDRFRQAAFVCTPIDFHRSGRLATWANPDTFPLDALVAGPRNFPAWRMSDSFTWLRVSGSSRKWMSLWERIDDPGFPELWAAFEHWNTDGVDFPGTAYREYVRRCYFENALIEGGWVLGATPVDLRNARIPALVIAADGDHVATPESCGGLERVWGGPVEVTRLPGGHVGISVTRALPKALVAWSAR